MHLLFTMTILFLYMTNIHGFTPRISFTDPIDYNDQGGMCHNEGNWTLRGTLEMSKYDSLIFQTKAVIQTCSTLCTVDLEMCGPESSPTPSESCYCSKRTGDVYEINISAAAKLEHSGKQVHTVIPSHEEFGPITASAIIGQVPTISKKTTRVDARYRVDRGLAQTLLPIQTIDVCPEAFVELEVCVDKPGPDSVMKLTLGGQEVVSSRACVDFIRRYDVTSTSSHRVTFSYRESNSCTHEELSVFLIQENKSGCNRSTPVTEASTVSAEKTTAPTPVKTTPTPTPVAGVCPDTPRSLITLPWLYSEILVDEISFNTTWTIIQRRVSGDVNFYRSWADSVRGFGQVNDSFWLGLEHIHDICNKERKCELLINLMYRGKPQEVSLRADGCYHAMYSEFWLGGADDNYRLHVGQYSGSAGDSLMYNVPGSNLNQHQFSTYDRDNDDSPNYNCAKGDYGSWWYARCSRSTLNSGHWGKKGSWSGVTWYSLAGQNSVEFTEMKVRHRS